MKPGWSKRPADSGGGDSRDKHHKIDRIHVLRRCSLFKALSGWEISSISKLTRIVEYKKDEAVYRSGEAATAFYIVVSGRFEAYVMHGTSRHVLAYLKQGNYFGEMSLLADENHTATVQALSDSLVLAISKEDFKKIIENNAAISLEISRVLTARVRAQNVPAPRPLHLLKSEVVSVYSAHRRMGQTSFTINLAASLHHETGQKTVLVDMSPTGSVIFDRLKIAKKTDIGTFQDLEKGIETTLSNHLISHGSGIDVLNLATQDMQGSRAAELVIHLLNRLSVDFRFVVVDLPNQIDDTVLNVMSQSDHLFFVTDNNMGNVSEIQQIMTELEKSIASTDEKTKIIINESFLGFSPTNTVKKELFGRKDCFFLPSTPAMKEEGPTESLVVLSHPDVDYSKIIRLIARKLSKNLIGLALGSGAALGFAHIGVLKVLEREKIPIDLISGSSMGALIASFYATGRSPLELQQIAAKMNKFNLLSKIDFPLFPVRGLIKGRRFQKFFEHYLRDMTFEDTRIPLIIVGTSLNTRKEVLFNSGLVSTALRASVAIPGIFAPVITDGDVIVDGGIIDPLPIRPLADLGANKIIAVDVLPTPSDVLEKRSHHEEVQRRIDAKMKNRHFAFQALYGLKKSFSRATSPNIIDIIVNSMQAMEHEMAEALGHEADVCIRPSMPLFNWVEFHKSRDIIQQGELAAEAKLEEIKAMVKQQVI